MLSKHFSLKQSFLLISKIANAHKSARVEITVFVSKNMDALFTAAVPMKNPSVIIQKLREFRENKKLLYVFALGILRAIKGNPIINRIMKNALVTGARGITSLKIFVNIEQYIVKTTVFKNTKDGKLYFKNPCPSLVKIKANAPLKITDDKNNVLNIVKITVFFVSTMFKTPYDNIIRAQDPSENRINLYAL